MDNKNVLIILSHPEQKSFCSSLAKEAENFFKTKNCLVTVRDLYKMNFNPVAGPSDFTKISEKGKQHFQLGVEQREAAHTGTLKNDIKIEQDIIKKSDLILFVFPLWWSSCPAIMKGYIDRVLTHGFAFDALTNELFNNGLLKGKEVKCIVTAGGAEEYYLPEGPHKMTVEERLEHLTFGSLAFCGLNIHKSFIAHGVSPMTPKEKLEELTSNLQKDLENIGKEPLLIQMN